MIREQYPSTWLHSLIDIETLGMFSLANSGMEAWFPSASLMLFSRKSQLTTVSMSALRRELGQLVCPIAEYTTKVRRAAQVGRMWRENVDDIMSAAGNIIKGKKGKVKIL